MAKAKAKKDLVWVMEPRIQATGNSGNRQTRQDGGLPLLQASGLRVQFHLRGGKQLVAVDGVNLAIRNGEILGLVGESGCGKTVCSLALLRLVDPPGRITDGRVIWLGKDLLRLDEASIRKVRGKEIAMIFQNPQSSLNPIHTVGRQLIAVLRLHRRMTNTEATDEARRLLLTVHIPDPERALQAYPHQFSVGMCQRVMIAMALACRPRLLIADEPTASLDVTIQAQILDLLLEIRETFEMAILLVSHDLGVIATMCDRIAVMYLGRIVEEATPKELFGRPLHPYTQALLDSIAAPNPEAPRKKPGLFGDIPSPTDLPSGCRFRTRCPMAFDLCPKIDPILKPVKTDHHQPNSRREVACLLYE